MGLEGRARRRDPGADAPARRERRLDAASASPWTRALPRRAHHLQAALRRRPDLPRRADGQLVARLRTALSDLEVEHEEVEGELVSIRYGDGDDSDRRRHHPGRDDAGRHRDRRAPGRRALPAPGRPRDRCRWSTAHPDRRRRPRRPRSSAPARSKSRPRTTRTTSRSAAGTACRCRRSWTRAGIADTGTEFDGMDRFEARVAVREALRAQGRIVAEKRPYLHSVGHSERSGEPIEPRLSLQWWVKVEAAGQGRGRRGARRATSSSTRELEPRWFAWVDNMHDWCISRQLWWGHRIPVWHGPTARWSACGPGRGAARPAGSRTPTCSTPGSPRGCGRSPRSAGPTRPRTWRSSIRRRCWSRATTSCSSGSPG